MERERWQRVKCIVADALELAPDERAAFLDEACGQDDAFRVEVESLLTEPNSSFLSSLEDSGPTAVLAGRTLSHYRLSEEISRGGMGVVYRAVDLKLDREVAIKVLPPELVRSPERNRRFIREAKAAAALSHPHIATIHDIDEDAGVTFIAMELIRGQKLSELLESAPLPIERALDLMHGVAEGLQTAHAHGIVHRDIKPANIMVTETGHPKIIDFGLAKLIEPLSGEADGRTRPRTDTAPGVLMGTLSYMSPEQARGLAVDARSDIFSFGIVLFEALTGKLPFRAPSTAEIPHAIIHDDTPRLELEEPETEELQAILDRCLTKDPEERYGSTESLRAELDAVRRNRYPKRFSRRRRRLTPVMGAVAAAAALGMLYIGRTSDVGAPVPSFGNPIQVTSAVGAEDAPAWSHDGESLAYQSNRNGNWDIWISRIGGGEAFNRTQDHMGEDLYPSWSPDGSRIAFWSDREGNGYYVMSALAGPARKVVTSEPAGPLHWSPDGAELTHVSADAGGVYFENVSIEGGERHRIPAPGDNVFRIQPSWSPDERLVAYMDASAYNSTIHSLLLLRIEDGRHFPITNGRSRVWNATWSRDGRHLYYVSSVGGSGDLWQQAISREGVPMGEPVRVTAGMGLRHAAISPDGRRLAYSRGRRMVNLWKIPILRDRPATWADATPLTFDEAFVGFVGLASGGDALVFSSDRQGNQDIWAMPKQGGAMRQLTNDPATDLSPVGSPDGSYVAFYSNRAGSRDIFVMPASGGAARQLTTDPAEDWHPDWSPDGGHITFVSTRSGSRDIWVIPFEGGAPRQLTRMPGSELFPKWSPDGRSILFYTEKGLWTIPAKGGKPAPLVPQEHRGYSRWAPDGRHVYWVQLRASTGRLWELSVDSGAIRPVAALEGRPGTLHDLALATDGESLFFGWDEDVGDLWVVDLVPEKAATADEP